jgi:hypothetical protein
VLGADRDSELFGPAYDERDGRSRRDVDHHLLSLGITLSSIALPVRHSGVR